MTQRKIHRISKLPATPKAKYKEILNYGRNNDFIFSSDINDWQYSKARPRKSNPQPEQFAVSES